MKRENLAWAGRLVLGVLFLTSGGLKVVDPGQFGRAIADYQLVGPALVPPLAYFLPWLEVVAGLGLVTGLAARGGAVIANGLLLVFIVALISALARGMQVDCGCFGGLEEKLTGQIASGPGAALIRDLLFLPLGAWGLWGAFSGRRPRS